MFIIKLNYVKPCHLSLYLLSIRKTYIILFFILPISICVCKQTNLQTYYYAHK